MPRSNPILRNTAVLYPGIVIVIGLISFTISIKIKYDIAKADSDINSYPKVEDYIVPPASKPIDTFGLELEKEEEPIKVSFIPDYKHDAAPVSLTNKNQIDAEKPVFSITPGSYPASSFPLRLIITNPNPAATWVMVSINGRKFVKYKNQTLYIEHGDTVEAFARGDTLLWNPSEVVSAKYRQQLDIKRYRAPVRRITQRR